MKTYCKGLTVDHELVGAAYIAWTKAQAGKKNKHRVIQEHGSVEALVDEIVSEISSRKLSFRTIHYYTHRESSGKVRRIGVQSVKQQIVDYVVVVSLEKLFSAKIGYYQVSSIPGKGQLFAAKTAKKWIGSGSGYFVHLDVVKFYPNISHKIVTTIVEKYVGSSDIRHTISVLLSTYENGLAIGSFFSLKMSQLYLSFAYHFLSDLKGVGEQKFDFMFYADDLILHCADKNRLIDVTKQLEKYLCRELDLEIKSWKVCKVGVDEPLDIAGYVVRPDKIVVRDTIFLRARKSFRRFAKNSNEKNARQVCSYWGWLKHADTFLFQRREQLNHLKRIACKLISEKERSFL